MILGSWAGRAPAVLAIGCGDGKVVNGGEAPAHQPTGIELPVLVAVGAEPVSRVVVPLVGEAHGDAVLAACPDFLDEPVIELAAPLAAQELLDGRAPVQKLGTVAPQRVLRVRERHALRITAVPGVLRHPHLGDCARPGEGRPDGRDRRRCARHPVTHIVPSGVREVGRTRLTTAPASASSAARHSAKFEPAGPQARNKMATPAAPRVWPSRRAALSMPPATPLRACGAEFMMARLLGAWKKPKPTTPTAMRPPQPHE